MGKRPATPSAIVSDCSVVRSPRLRARWLSTHALPPSPAPRRPERPAQRRTTERHSAIPGRWSPHPRTSQDPSCLRAAGCRHAGRWPLPAREPVRGRRQPAPTWRPVPGCDRARSRATIVKQARDYLCAAALEAAHRVCRLELDAHGAAETGLQRLATEQRRVEKKGVDYLASRPNTSRVEAGVVHDAAA